MADEHPEVTIDARPIDSARNVEIRIQDNGPGIDADKMERIFDPFYTTRSTGTGLGLAIAAMTCKEHGGHIYAQNQVKGGAEFVISLPAIDLENSLIKDSGIPPMDNRLQREVA